MPTRRTFTRWTVTALALCAPFAAPAQTYPERPIRMIVGFPPGNSTDSVARLIAQKMGEELKQTVFVDNRVGAAGIISHEAVKNSPPDGYTLLMGSSATLAINPTLYRKLPYDPLRDFEPVVTVSKGPLYLVASNTTPVKNFKEFVAYVKGNPGKATYGTGGNGTTQHIAMEMLKKALDLDILHVPYKGSPQMITDIIGGQINFAFDSGPSIVPHVKDGRVRALAVSATQRTLVQPDVPTVAEQGVPGFEAVAWLAIVAPRGTPAAVVQRLNAAANVALKSPEVIAQTSLTGGTLIGGTVTELSAYMRSELARWGKAVKDSGAQVD